MAVTYQSVSTTAWGVLNNVLAITKPSGLAVGDLMIAHVAVNTPRVFSSVPSGFTLKTSGSTTNINSYVYYKVADSGDVAASQFTFTADAVATSGAGSIFRISGQMTTSPITEANTATATATNTPSFSNSITPHNVNNLLVFMTTSYAGSGGILGISGQAIATNNPTWTESYDNTKATSAEYNMSGAYATRSEITSTGNSSFTISGPTAGTTQHIGHIVSIDEVFTTTTTDTITESDVSFMGITTTSVDTITQTDAILSEKAKIWQTVDKSSSTWINVDKS